MRNKAKFISDAYAVMKEEFKEEVNVVEDAAHIMSQTGNCCYELEEQFTNTGKKEVFNFEVKERPKTDNQDEKIEDFFYIGKENA